MLLELCTINTYVSSLCWSKCNGKGFASVMPPLYSATVVNVVPSVDMSILKSMGNAMVVYPSVLASYIG